MKILLVDDADLFLDLEKSYLKRESFTFLTAKSGVEALENIRSQKPDLILLDLLMPGMDGDTVCRELKADPATHSIPVVLISSSKDPELQKRCYAAGCDAYVSKPLKRDELLDAIDRLILIAKRCHPRVPTHILAYVHYGERTMESWIHTISSGGLFLELESAPEPGEHMEVSFPIPGIHDPVRATARIQWCGRVRADGPFGAGVEFVRLGETERGIITSYVEEKLNAIGSLKGFA
jgi:CheY-like chemotaxis protein